MLLIPAALASCRPNSRKPSQQSIASTEPVGPTILASLMAVSPKPQPTSTTLSPGLTRRVGKIASLCSVNPSTMMCFQRTNFGTRTSFQKSTYWLRGGSLCAVSWTDMGFSRLADAGCILTVSRESARTVSNLLSHGNRFTLTVLPAASYAGIESAAAGRRRS